jgi:hypothetical protein
MLRAVGVTFAAFVFGCGDPPIAPPIPPIAAATADAGRLQPELMATPALPDAAATEIAIPVEVDPGYAPDVESLRALRSSVVRQFPDSHSAPLGTVAQDMRVAWTRAANGRGCQRVWVEIEPKGWLCSTYLEPNTRSPRLVELPRIPEGEVVPGLYGKVLGARTRAFKTLGDARRRRGGRPLADATLVKFNREIAFGRQRFWRTTSGELVDARRVMPRDASRLAGIELGTGRGPVLPFGWIRSDLPATVWEEPERWIELGQLPPRTVVPTARHSTDGASLRLAPGLWIDAKSVRVARLVPPPRGLRPEEKWIDIDLAEQVLVAYEGTRPVFATLVSTGERKRTPTGTWRIWIKFAETEMTGMVKGRTYQVADVPWTMFFNGGFALHGAYWHDKFGQRTSSGCVNLAPADARLLYRWTDPQVPDGWTMAYPTADSPGTLIRIRKGTAGIFPAPGKLASR